ncbi:thiamine diphosphokinase [Loktanella sp. Alg231-35]|uniref:thiamine diphosphokinase n=1 Tax=Loktanella sp. Alg231-35 TaxID=1922220 RepID=UPI001F1B6D3F|nr:thiamine diphosphokinase [Loktanella sp. Alg231-35]
MIDRYIGVDGGADHLLDAGVTPAAVIGDLDSLSCRARATFADLLHPVDDQSTTDFEKVLQRVEAPMMICLGFTGGRMDHTLSVLNVMVRFADRAVVLVDEDDASFLANPGQTRLALPVGTRVSIMPLGAATVSVQGLQWSFADQLMTPDGFTSPSNAASEEEVTITTDGPVLITLPQDCLQTALIAAVRAG